MSWFSAYMLWTLSSIKTLFGVVTFISWSVTFVWIITALFWASEIREDRPRGDKEKYLEYAKTWYTRSRRLAWSVGVFASIAILFTTLLPNSETLVKIIATKKGVELMQTQRAQNIADKSGQLMEDSIELLIKTIQDKMNPKKQEEKK